MLSNAMRHLALLALLLGGCYQRHGLDPARDAGTDAGCVEITPDDGGTITAERVDLLLMVDGSNSMSEEQESLRVALPTMVRALSSGDVDFDGDPEFPPVGSLRLGVVTADMGTGGFAVPTCDDSRFGDDGVLTTGGARCGVEHPRFLTFDDAADWGGPDDFAEAAGCAMSVGTGGCGFEQQLESVLKAVTPARASVRFFGDTPGHGDTTNEGFVRPDSVLVVVLVTDENDCSSADPELYRLDDGPYVRTDVNARCFVHPEALHPTARYVDGLLALRRDDPGRLVFATIAGIPPSLETMPEETILSAPEVREERDPRMPTRLRPSCDVPGRGVAFPPTRLLEVGREIRQRGGRTIHLSICEEDFTPAVRLILTEVGRAIRPRCR